MLGQVSRAVGAAPGLAGGRSAQRTAGSGARPCGRGAPRHGASGVPRRARAAAPWRRGRTTCAYAPSEVAEAVQKRFLKVQNGSDIRGVTVEGVPGEPITLSDDMAYYIGRAFAHWLAKTTNKPPTELRIAIGKDPRISGPNITMAFGAGVTSTGACIDVAGLATTPAMFMSTVLPSLKFDAGVMCTASHLPYNRNGLKFFTPAGGLDKPDIKAILELATEDNILAAKSVTEHPGKVDAGVVALAGRRALLEGAMMSTPCLMSQDDVVSPYVTHLQDVIRRVADNGERPLEGLKIVVDAGNGSGGFYASRVLEPLGADVAGSQFLDPDGMFPNHPPNPEDSRAMASAAEAVLRVGADLGIVFDTDVDRAGVIDETGREINRNRLIAVLSAIMLEKSPGSTIVTDSITSNGLADFIRAKGGRHLRFKRGYKNVIAKGVELNNSGTTCELMIETSGHGACKENYFLDDGAYLATLIVAELVAIRKHGGTSIAQLLEGFVDPADEAEYRLKVQADDFKPVGDEALRRLKEAVDAGVEGWTMEEENFEGWRVKVDEGEGREGWFLLRQSLHDPVMVLNVESQVEGGCAATVARVRELMESFDLPLDLSALP
ncbi:unnamed protein product [Pedinophyceae sp. YPF-701]|nr:unnamed protein product [Pedinophyceae sp. YPF-701]